MMNTPLSIQWFGNREIQAVCWTLVHSLWVGILAAAVAGVLIAVTRRSAPRLRYRLLCGLLFAFVISMAFILNAQLDSQGTDTAFASSQSGTRVAASSLSANWSRLGQASLLNGFVNFLNRQSSWIFGFWLLCFLAKSARLVGGMVYIRRIRSQRNFAVPAGWQEKVNDLARQLGIRRTVLLRQSELVKVPVTVGLLKPVILLPVGMIFQLMPGQLETILIHELAHIYRRDYLVNILQRMVEAIFFFNPAILWISSLVRDERESCCDDVVLENVSLKRNYLEALLAFQQGNAHAGSLALALSLRKDQLMARVRRMVNKENQRLNPLEVGFLVFGLLFLSAFTFIPEVKPGIEKGVRYIGKTIRSSLETPVPAIRKTAPKAQAMPDTASVKQEIFTPPDTLRRFTSMLFNGSNGDTSNFEATLTDDRGNRYVLKKSGGEVAGIELNGVAVASADLVKHTTLVQDIMRFWAETRAGKRLKVASFAALKTERTSSPLAGKGKGGKTAADLVKSPAPKEKGKKIRVQTDLPGGVERVRLVLGELVAAGVVKSSDEVRSFGLSDDRLTVNDVEQSAELRKKLAATYGIKPGFGLFYGPVIGGGKGVIVDKLD